MQDDFKSKHEAQGEWKYILGQLSYTLNNFKTWTKDTYVSTPMINKLDGCHTRWEPYGVCLIIGAWNYPLDVVLNPMLGAIAAGNVVCLKPSELAPKTAQALAKMIETHLDPRCYRVFLGGAEKVTALMTCPLDYVFYTGGTHVGKLIYQQAAAKLIPVTLELGGKRYSSSTTTCPESIPPFVLVYPHVHT